MLNCNYGDSTAYRFTNCDCIQDDHIDILGTYPGDKIENILNCSTGADKWTEFFIPEVVDMPAENPPIESISAIKSSIDIISQRVVKTPTVKGYTPVNSLEIPGEKIGNGECTNLTGRKLVIEGVLNQKIIYTATLTEQSLHAARFCIPFSIFIIIDKDTVMSQKFKITPYIEDIFACRLSDTTIFKNTTIFLRASKIC